ncbi:lysophospholipid acyltransferase family protein [Phaeocystidibacter luteus]|uniref:Lysophospholipid acyltransferase family protein n=1 Tax=Phaeocystidibacter luteus TaxID=911197 RepID=A0A6N6RET7_9FLAO|nr:lysophospholipid acyltransferase family protein [Phaeocystidibacter luteus]KAB2805383.1 hypothetical protein F8C67_13695 [Phaeocystidibacter luteus]
MIAYIFFRIFDAIIAILPWRGVYALANFAYFVLFRVIKYRVELVKENFRKCFPEKDELWINSMTKTYYRYLSEIFIESIKAMHVSSEEIKKRFRLEGEDVIRKHNLQHQNIIIIGSHYGNWEFMTRGLPHIVPHEVAGVYRPLSNRRIEKYMAKHRSKDGMWLVPTEKSKESWTEKRERPVAFGLLADQNPSNPKRSYWINFLNRETGFTPGAEVYAKKYDYPVVLMLLKRVKRGHYTVHFEELEFNPTEIEFGDIMRKYAAKLEAWIQNDPPYWLWSHRRWKHKMPEDYTAMTPLK